MKQLTIVIPCSRPETCMDQISGYMRGADERLEILVVQKDPALDTETRNGIRILSEESGCFGEAVKAGLEAAEGRYFMILCEEDKLRAENLSGFLDLLEKAHPDIFIFGYTLNSEEGEILRSYAPISDISGCMIDIIKLSEKYPDLRICLNSWSMCYETEFLRRLELPLSGAERGEMPVYSVIPFIHAESFEIFPMIMCEMLLRNVESKAEPPEDQTWFLGQKREMEQTVDYYVSKKPLGKARDTFLLKQLASAVSTCYGLFLIDDPEKEQGKKLAGELRFFLSEKEPRLAGLTERKYKRLLRLRRFRKGGQKYLKTLFPQSL